MIIFVVELFETMEKHGRLKQFARFYIVPIVSPVVVALLGNGELCQKIFLPISNQPTNRYLKDIMADLKIDKTMTFHVGRHSFQTIAAKKASVTE